MTFLSCCSQRAVYQNLDDLYQDTTEDSVISDAADLYGYGDEKIYDSICYYQSPVSTGIQTPSERDHLNDSMSASVISTYDVS